MQESKAKSLAHTICGIYVYHGVSFSSFLQAVSVVSPPKRTLVRFLKDFCLSIILRPPFLPSWHTVGQLDIRNFTGTSLCVEWKWCKRRSRQRLSCSDGFFPKGRSVSPPNKWWGLVCVFWPNFHHIILKIGSNWCGICAVSVLYMVVLGGFCNDWGLKEWPLFGEAFGGLKRNNIYKIENYKEHI